MSLINLVKALKTLTLERNSKQGLIIFDAFINNYQNEDKKKDVLLLKKLYSSLCGIEAHGHSTNEEYLLFQKIRKEIIFKLDHHN